MKIKVLNKLASEMVGDGKRTNCFFVTKDADVQMVTLDFDAAYDYWHSLPRTVETTLEDRKFGCICTTEPSEDNPNRLVTYDDSEVFLKNYRLTRR